MSFDVEACMAWLNSEAGKKAIKEYCARMDKERKEQYDFFETPVFNKYIEEIREMLGSEKVIDSETLLYHPWQYLLPYRSFMNVFNAVFANHTPINSDNSGFPTETVEYSGIKFVATHGQGTCYSMELIK